MCGFLELIFKEVLFVCLFVCLEQNKFCGNSIHLISFDARAVKICLYIGRYNCVNVGSQHYNTKNKALIQVISDLMTYM